jgi:tubulin polyglutamylase TTLL5
MGRTLVLPIVTVAGAASRRFCVHPPHSLPLVTEVLTAAGWERGELSDDWTLLWSLGAPAPAVYRRLQAGQHVSHLPGIGALTRKDSLAKTVERGRRLLAARGIDIPPFMPETYVMPDDLAALRAHAADEPGARWIQKPRSAARGIGVRLLADLDEVETGSNWLVQRYLDRPHLIDGRKYTLRWYVVVTSLDPLTVLVLDDGFTKLASRPFSLSGEDFADRLRHLTNPEVQAGNASVTVSRDNLTRPAYARLLRSQGHDPDELFARIETLIAVTVGAARDALARATWHATDHPAGCFELLGLDVLVDEELRPWLLECNLDPSLVVEAAADRAALEERELKGALVHEVLRAIGLLDSDADVPARMRAMLPDPGRRGRLLPLPRPGEDADPPRLVAAPGLTVLPVENHHLVHEPLSGEAHVLDSLGAYLLTAHSDGLTPEEIVDEVSDAWPDSAWRVEQDYRNALAHWHELGLVVPAAAEPAPLPTPPIAVPRIRWNRERVYRCLDTWMSVLVPDDEVDGWVQLVLGGLEDDGAESVHLRVEIVRSRAGWDVVSDDGRRRCPSPRQLGSALRALLLRHALAASKPPAFTATLLADDDIRLLLIGPRSVRARVAQAWVQDGGLCLGDDIVRVADGARLSGGRHGLAVGLGVRWLGPLPDLDDADPVHIAEDGSFARMWWPDPVEEAAAAPPSAILCSQPGGRRARAFAPRPATELAVVRALLGSLPGRTRISSLHVRAAVAVAGSAPSVRAVLDDPAIDRATLTLALQMC